MRRLITRQIMSLMFILFVSIILLTFHKSYSKYISLANMEIAVAKPIIELSEVYFELDFSNLGYIPYNFDVLNYNDNNVNQVEMEYYIIPIYDNDFPLEIGSVCKLENGICISASYNEEVGGYGPFTLSYDNEEIINHSIVFVWKGCYLTNGVERPSCTSVNDMRISNKDYNFDIEVKAYQKSNESEEQNDE